MTDTAILPQVESTSRTPINLKAKLALFADLWSPKVIAEMNDYQFKLVKLQGDFVWHHHQHTDETFLVLEGHLRIDFRDGAVHLGPGELFIVPKGVEHKPFASEEAHVLLIEPRGVVNTGTESGTETTSETTTLTAPNDVWI